MRATYCFAVRRLALGGILTMAASHGFSVEAIAQPACVIESGSWKPSAAPYRRNVTAQANSVCNHGLYIRPETAERTGIEVTHLTSPSINSACGTLRLKPAKEGWIYQVGPETTCSGYFEVHVSTHRRDRPAVQDITIFQYYLTVKP